MRRKGKHKGNPYFHLLLRRLQSNVRYLRSELNLTLEDAAEGAKIHWRHWQKIEAGEINATLGTLTRIASCLGAEPHELLGAELPPVRSKLAMKRRRRTRKKS